MSEPCPAATLLTERLTAIARRGDGPRTPVRIVPTRTTVATRTAKAGVARTLCAGERDGGRDRVGRRGRGTAGSACVC